MIVQKNDIIGRSSDSQNVRRKKRTPAKTQTTKTPTKTNSLSPRFKEKDDH